MLCIRSWLIKIGANDKRLVKIIKLGVLFSSEAIIYLIELSRKANSFIAQLDQYIQSHLLILHGLLDSQDVVKCSVQLANKFPSKSLSMAVYSKLEIGN